MILLIAGASHAGKTALAQRLLEAYRFPYLSIDHLKMGLIRSGQTTLTPMDDDKLTEYLWPVVREMIKTAIENHQNLIVEGCYIPFDWEKDFAPEYLENIRYCCLVMSQRYIRNHFADIVGYADVVEKRLADDCSMESVLAANAEALQMCQKYNCDYVWIDTDYAAEIAKGMEKMGLEIIPEPHTDTWENLYKEAVKVQNGRMISPFVEAGGVAAAILTKKGNVYVGVCIDTASTLGMCAERNAIANMLTHGESQIDKVVAVMPDGKVGPPCGACREFMMQLDRDSGEIEILLDMTSRKTVLLKELVPHWWGESRFVAEEKKQEANPA